jgi:hypothetical protein
MRKFLRECLSEGDGQGSFGRLITLVIVTFVMGWDTSNIVFAWRFNLAHFQGPILPLLPDAGTLIAQGDLYDAVLHASTRLAGTYENVKVPSLVTPAPAVPTAPTQ